MDNFKSSGKGYSKMKFLLKNVLFHIFFLLIHVFYELCETPFICSILLVDAKRYKYNRDLDYALKCSVSRIENDSTNNCEGMSSESKLFNQCRIKESKIISSIRIIPKTQGCISGGQASASPKKVVLSFSLGKVVHQEDVVH